VLQVGKATDVGGRAANEDGCLAMVFHSGGVSRGVIAVADGMGGMYQGAEASRIVIRHLRAALSGLPPSGDPTSALASAFESALQEMKSRGGPVAEFMGSTCTAAVADGDELHVSHIGDCRAYLIRDGAVHRLTTDHSAYADALRARRPGEDVPDPGMQSIVMRAIGPFGSATPDASRVPWETGDVLVICCDGVWQFVEEEFLRKAFAANCSVHAACSRIVEQAVREGTNDNATVAAVRVQRRWRNADRLTRPPKDRVWRKLRRPLLIAVAVLFVVVLLLLWLRSIWSSGEPEHSGAVVPPGHMVWCGVVDGVQPGHACREPACARPPVGGFARARRHDGGDLLSGPERWGACTAPCAGRSGWAWPSGVPPGPA
jgi:protein phosphatase